MTVLDRSARPPRSEAVIRELGFADLDRLRRLVDADPIVNAVFAARIGIAELEVSASAPVPPGHDGADAAAVLGGSVIGVERGGALVAAAFHGGNLMPVGDDAGALAALAAYFAARPRVCSAVVGRNDVIGPFWQVLGPHWPRPRLIRHRQPMLACSTVPLGRPGPEVRVATRVDVDRYVPAAAAMFTEELGLSPYLHVSRAAYRERLLALIDAGRALVVTDDAGHVIFKAELAAVSGATCQIQGVWVRPDHRGRGLATVAMARVLARAMSLAPTASLYVNDFNIPARRLYDRLGLQPVATLSTVLF